MIGYAPLLKRKKGQLAGLRPARAKICLDHGVGKGGGGGGPAKVAGAKVCEEEEEEESSKHKKQKESKEQSSVKRKQSKPSQLWPARRRRRPLCPLHDLNISLLLLPAGQRAVLSFFKVGVHSLS